MPRESLKGSNAALKGAVNDVKAAGKAVKAMKVAAAVEVEPEPAPVFSDGPASAAKSVCSGVGIHTALARQTATFNIEAFDEEGIKVNKGGTPFFVAIRGSAMVKARITDNGDGTCLCEYRPSVSGNFSIAVSIHGVPLAGSPFPLQVLQPRPDPPQCVLHGEGLREAVARERTDFFIEFVDKLGQVTHAEEVDVWVEPVDEGEWQAALSSMNNSSSSSSSSNSSSTDADATGTGATADGAVDGAAVDGAAGSTATAGDGSVEDSAAAAPAADAGAATSTALASGAADATEDSASAAAGGTVGSSAVPPSKFRRIEAGERQQHLQLWQRRLAADKAIAATAAKALGDGGDEGAGSAAGSPPQQKSAMVGMSLAHELLLDKDGIGFAFGGVSPGTLHAKGQLVKTHTVSYSIGLAGRYKLHVGLRQQGVALPGSPFMLQVMPGGAYAPSTKMPRPKGSIEGGTTRATQRAGGSSAGGAADGGVRAASMRAGGSLVGTAYDGLLGSPQDKLAGGGKGGKERNVLVGGTVGKEWHGILMPASDKMGNLCTQGGANVQVTAHGTEAEKLKTRCVDHGDGTYMLGWRAEASGVYTMHVTIDGQHVVGSPAQLVMTAAKPEVSSCEVTGLGLTRAVAGKQAIVRVRLRDKYLNPAKPLPDMVFGLAMLPAEPAEVVKTKKEKKANRLPGEKTPVVSAEENEASDAPRKKDRFDRPGAIDMAFDGQWIGDEYELRYVPKEAGDFELNVWCMLGEKITSMADAAKAILAVESPSYASERQKLPGAPFALHVAEGKAHAASSFMEGDEAAQQGSITAGERFTVRAQLRDQYNNATDAPEGSLIATLDCPDFEGSEDPMRREHTELQLRPKGGMGEYDLTYEPHIRGLHVVRMKLGGVEIAGSPIQLTCMPGPPLASKSKLHHPSTPPVTQQPVVMRVELIDRFGNGVGKGGARVDGRAMGASAGSCTVEDHNDGTYTVSFTANAIGDYKVTVRLENKDEISPISMYIAEGKPIQRASAPAPAPPRPQAGQKLGSAPSAAEDGLPSRAPGEAEPPQPPTASMPTEPVAASPRSAPPHPAASAPAPPVTADLFEKPTFSQSSTVDALAAAVDVTDAAGDTAGAEVEAILAGQEEEEEEEGEDAAEAEPTKGGKGTPAKAKKAKKKKKSARGKSPAKATAAKPDAAAAKPSDAKPAAAKPAAAKPAPAKPTPAKPTPAKTTPAKPTPAKPTPAKPTPAKPTPAKPAQASPAPAKPAPSNAAAKPAASPAAKPDASPAAKPAAPPAAKPTAPPVATGSKPPKADASKPAGGKSASPAKGSNKGGDKPANGEKQKGEKTPKKIKSARFKFDPIEAEPPLSAKKAPSPVVGASALKSAIQSESAFAASSGGEQIGGIPTIIDDLELEEDPPPAAAAVTAKPEGKKKQPPKAPPSASPSPPPQPLPGSSRGVPPSAAGSGAAPTQQQQQQASTPPPQQQAIAEEEELADWEKPQGSSLDDLVVPSKVPTARGVTNLRARLMSRGF